MNNKISKKGAEIKIKEFFKEIQNKTPKEIQKVRKLSMKFQIKLKEKRKSFCKKCLNPYKNPKIRIKDKTKIIKCNKCGYSARFKLS